MATPFRENYTRSMLLPFNFQLFTSSVPPSRLRTTVIGGAVAPSPPAGTFTRDGHQLPIRGKVEQLFPIAAPRGLGAARRRDFGTLRRSPGSLHVDLIQAAASAVSALNVICSRSLKADTTT